MRKGGYRRASTGCVLENEVLGIKGERGFRFIALPSFKTDDHTHCCLRKAGRALFLVQKLKAGLRPPVPPATLVQTFRSAVLQGMLLPSHAAAAAAAATPLWKGQIRVCRSTFVFGLLLYLVGGDDLADQVKADHERVDTEVEGAPHVQRLRQTEQLEKRQSTWDGRGAKRQKPQQHQQKRRHRQHRKDAWGAKGGKGGRGGRKIRQGQRFVGKWVDCTAVTGQQ